MPLRQSLHRQGNGPCKGYAIIENSKLPRGVMPNNRRLPGPYIRDAETGDSMPACDEVYYRRWISSSAKDALAQEIEHWQLTGYG